MKSASKKRAPTIVNLTVKRRYLTQREIERLMDCARKHGRYGHRDATQSGVTRCGRCASYAAITRETPTYSFPSAAGQSFHRLIQRVGEAAKMPFPIHPHMLRHACRLRHTGSAALPRAQEH